MKRALLILCLCLSGVSYAQTLSLEQCLSMAEENGREVKNASLDVLSAQAMKAEARWEYFPRVSLTGLSYHALNPMLEITLRDVLGNSDAAVTLKEDLTARARENGIKPYYSTLNYGYSASVMVMQPLYAGGRIVNGNRLASLGVQASSLQRNLAGKALRDSVESKYWRVVALQEKQKIVSEGLALLDVLEKDLSSAVQAGLALESDLLSLRLKKSELQAGESRLRGGTILALMDLLDTIGYGYEYSNLRGITLLGAPDALPAPSEVLAENPDMSRTDESRLLNLQVDAKKLERKMAVGELLPQVAIGAGYGYNALMLPKQGRTNGLLFATVQVPLTDIGKAVARSRRYGYQIDKAIQDKEYLTGRLSLLEKKLRLEVETAWEQIGIASGTVECAEDALGRTSARYRAGHATASELMKVSLSVSTARDSLVSARIAYIKAVAAYRSALGAAAQ